MTDINFINRLLEKHGSPLFVFSEDRLIRNIRQFRAVFSSKYPKLEIAYSYKTNSLPGILRVIHGEGLRADACSGFEYEIARRLGVPGSSIVFNGPCKSHSELRRAVSDGAIINIDHEDELRLLEEIAAESDGMIEVGIRINLDAGIAQASDRFGFNLESGEAMEIVRRCAEGGLLKIIVLHVHLTSYIVEPINDESEDLTPAARVKLIYPKSAEMYRAASEKISLFASEIETRFGGEIKYLDMGGGFPSAESLEAYADAVANPILRNFGARMPTLILEPGRAIVRDAAYLVATVVASKKSPDGRRAVVIDAGVNLLPTSFWRWQEVECVEAGGGNLEETVVYGPLCLQTDIISRAKLPELRAGGKLIIKNVGAYNIAQGSSFIFPRPEIVMMRTGGGVEILREAERIEEII